jgi:uncharacterized protein YlxW (UPF0749 family)
MNVFASGSRHQPWVWQVTVLCFVLGLLLAGSIQTVGNIRRAGAGITRVGAAPFGAPQPQLTRKINELEKQVIELGESKTKLEESLSKEGTAAKALNEELQKTKVVAGLTAVEGPGIVLILQDSPGRKARSNRTFEEDLDYVIHEITLQRGINELNASGAEAISVNGQRITSRTAIRCVGPTAMINNVPLASPFEVRAIGDPATLVGALNIPRGFMESIQSFDPAMARIERRPLVKVPAYTGTTDFRFARPERAKETGDREAKH